LTTVKTQRVDPDGRTVISHWHWNTTCHQCFYAGSADERVHPICEEAPMKKKPQLNKKTIKNLKLKLKQISDRKAAPSLYEMAPSNGNSCV